MTGRVETRDIWNDFIDPALELVDRDGSPELDLDPRDEVVRVAHPRGEEIGVYHDADLGMGHSTVFALCQVDGQGQPERVRFGYGWNYNGSGQFEASLGTFEKDLQGRWRGKLHVSVAGVGANMGGTVLTINQPNQPIVAPAISDGVEEFSKILGQGFDSSGGANTAVVELDSRTAENFARAVTEHLQVGWQLAPLEPTAPNIAAHALSLGCGQDESDRSFLDSALERIASGPEKLTSSLAGSARKWAANLDQEQADDFRREALRAIAGSGKDNPLRALGVSLVGGEPDDYKTHCAGVVLQALASTLNGAAGTVAAWAFLKGDQASDKAAFYHATLTRLLEIDGTPGDLARIALNSRELAGASPVFATLAEGQFGADEDEQRWGRLGQAAGRSCPVLLRAIAQGYPAHPVALCLFGAQAAQQQDDPGPFAQAVFSEIREARRAPAEEDLGELEEAILATQPSAENLFVLAERVEKALAAQSDA